MSQPEYLTTAELAELVRRPVATIRTWHSRGVGPPAMKVGRGLLVARLLGLSKSAVYQAAQPGGTIPTVSIGKRKVVATATVLRLLDIDEPQRRPGLEPSDLDRVRELVDEPLRRALEVLTDLAVAVRAASALVDSPNGKGGPAEPPAVVSAPAAARRRGRGRCQP